MEFHQILSAYFGNFKAGHRPYVKMSKMKSWKSSAKAFLALRINLIRQWSFCDSSLGIRFDNVTTFWQSIREKGNFIDCLRSNQMSKCLLSSLPPGDQTELIMTSNCFMMFLYINISNFVLRCPQLRETMLCRMSYPHCPWTWNLNQSFIITRKHSII